MSMAMGGYKHETVKKCSMPIQTQLVNVGRMFSQHSRNMNFVNIVSNRSQTLIWYMMLTSGIILASISMYERWI